MIPSASPSYKPTLPPRPTVSTDVCTDGEANCLCGECVQECGDGPLDTTQCNSFCQYVAGTDPPILVFISPYDDYDGDIEVEFETEGSGCATTASLTPIGVYTIRKPPHNSNCNGDPRIFPNVYIKRHSDDEPVIINTSCANALYIGQAFDGKYEVVGYCNGDGTCGIDA